MYVLKSSRKKREMDIKALKFSLTIELNQIYYVELV